MWLERGFFNSLAISQNSRILELTCGDGFYTKHFYAKKASKIIACDKDKSAIETALRHNKLSNINFVVADILEKLPNGSFENIIWDFGFSWSEYFTDDQIRCILTEVKDRLIPRGIFSGFFILSKTIESPLDIIEINFKNADELKNFLSAYFKNVKIFETKYQERHNLYFFASDSPLPI